MALEPESGGEDAAGRTFLRSQDWLRGSLTRLPLCQPDSSHHNSLTPLLGFFFFYMMPDTFYDFILKGRIVYTQKNHICVIHKFETFFHDLNQGTTI